jgi:hypothetical protein
MAVSGSGTGMTGMEWIYCGEKDFENPLWNADGAFKDSS